MNTLKKFATRFPVLFGLMLIALYPVLAFLAYPVSMLFPSSEVGQLYSAAAIKLTMFLACVLILWRFGWIGASGITRIGSRKTWMVVAVIFAYHLVVDLYAFTGKVGIVTANSPMGLANLVYYLPASLFEEMMFRGLILLAMVSAWGDTKRGLAKAVFFSSLLFGLIHLYNLANLPAGVVGLEAVGAAMLGILWAALVLISGSLWPAILLHWLTNAAVNIQLIGIDNFQETYGVHIQMIILFIPMVILGAYLVWKIPEPRQTENQAQLTPIFNSNP